MYPSSQFVRVKMANTHQWHSAPQADLTKKNERTVGYQSSACNLRRAGVQACRRARNSCDKYKITSYLSP